MSNSNIRTAIGSIAAVIVIGGVIGGSWVAGPGPAVLVLTPPSVSFGNQTTGTTSIELTATIQNTGQSNLTYTPTITGINSNQFLISSDPCAGVVQPNVSCNVGVEFAPTSIGSLSGSFTINDNTVGSPHSVPLTGVGTNPGATLAALFVATSGSASCTRNNSGTTTFANAAGHICDTFQHAYTAAACGDPIPIEGGTYPAQSISRGTDKNCGVGTCDQFQSDVSTAPTGTTQNCITFKPDGCSSPVQIGVSAATSNNILTNADYLRIDGLGCMTVYGDLAIVGRSNLNISDTCNTGWGHDVIVQNTTFDGQFNTTLSASQGTFQIQGTTNVSIINSTFKDAIGSTGAGVVNRLADCAGTICSTLPNPCPPGAIVPDTYAAISNTMLNHVTILDQVKTVASSGHCEGIHMEDNGGLISILNSKFEDLCEQDISLEPESPVASGPRILGLHIENTLFDYPSSHSVALGFANTFNASTFGNITIICHLAGTTVFNNLVFRNNSFINNAGSGGTIKWQIDPGCTPSTSGNILTGNILNGIQGCGQLWNTAAANIVPSGTGCGSDIPFGTNIFPYNDPANYDVGINPATAGVVYGAVPLSTGYPSTDTNGASRPNPADAGSVQHAALQTGASLATCTGGTCTEGTYTGPSRPSSCSTTPTASGVVPVSDTYVNLGNISDGVQNECRYYYVYVPAGLSGSAPVLMWAHGNVGCLDSASDVGVAALDKLANTNKMIVVALMLGWSSSGSACTSYRPSANWFHPERDIPDPGSALPQDYSYLRAVIADMESRTFGPTGAVSVDSKRLWLWGHSSGGGFVTGVACNDATSTLIRGMMAQTGWDVQSTSTSPFQPISGTERCGGGAEPLAANKSFFFELASIGGPGVTGYDGNCNAGPAHCFSSYPERMSYLASHFGCSAETKTFLDVGNFNWTDNYPNCAGSTYKVQGVVVTNSGDGINTMDDTLNGSTNTHGFAFQTMMDFFNNATWTGP